MPTVAVIGASRGIGLGLVKRYADEGWRVHATTRTPDSPGALGEVAGDVRLHGLDVADRAQQRSFRDALGEEGIDVLIHNAGVYGDGMTAAAVNRVNSEAPIEMAELLIDAVARSEQRKIALITSTMGARRGSRRGLGKYGDSKAALNDRFRALLARARLSRGRDPSRLGPHRHGRPPCRDLGRGKRARDLRGHGRPRRDPARPVLELGRARAPVVGAAYPR